MPSNSDVDQYLSGPTQAEGCHCAGTGWNDAVSPPNENGSVYPCPVHRPELYRRWVDGHLEFGHDCVDCRQIRSGRPSRRRVADHLAAQAAAEAEPPLDPWDGRKDLA